MHGLANMQGEAITDFLRDWEALFDHGDSRTIAAYYADDATLIATQTPTVQGRSAIGQFWQRSCEGAKAAGITRKVHKEDFGSDGDLGYIRGTVTLTRDGSQPPIVVRYLTLWKKQPDGAWRISVDISSAMPQP